MLKTLVSWTCIAVVLGPIAAVMARAETIITAKESSRTQQSNPDTNISDSSKITIRTTAGDPTRTYKSWIKFDVSELDVGNLQSATLTVTLFQERTGTSRIRNDLLLACRWDQCPAGLDSIQG